MWDRRIPLAAMCCILPLAACGDSPSVPPVVEPDCAALSLAPGQQQVFRNTDGLCFGLPAIAASEAYLVGVQSVSTVLSSLTPLTVELTTKGSAGASAAVSAEPGFGLSPAASAVTGAGPFPVMPAAVRQRSERLRTHRTAELRLRALERQLMEQAIRARRAPAGGPPLLNVAAAAVAQGDTVLLRVPDRTQTWSTSAEFCANYVEVRAVARVVGQRGIWLDDVGNPAGGFAVADYQQMSQEFDNTIYPRVVDYFGAPSDIDGNGRIMILTTKEINRFNATRPERAILGFVGTADFLPRDGVDGCALSNQGEIYYGVSPDPDRVFGWPAIHPYTREAAIEDSRSLIAHEFTHIIQFGRRITNPAATRLQDTWELEGQAMLAEEVVGHAYTNRAPRNNYGVNVSTDDWYWGHFVDLILYFGLDLDAENLDRKVPGAPEQCSWVDLGRDEGANGPCAGRHVYGVPWSLLRWVSDHYGEQTVQRQLIDNVTLSGLSNLAQVTGTPAWTMLARWSAMLYVDDRFPNMAPELTLPSWNLFDLFSRAPAAWQLQPRVRGFTAFSDTLSVRAGSTGYFRLSGANRPVGDVRVTPRLGGTLPSHIQLWVVRLQ
jgi:hypothetical protein